MRKTDILIEHQIEKYSQSCAVHIIKSKIKIFV